MLAHLRRPLFKKRFCPLASLVSILEAFRSSLAHWYEFGESNQSGSRKSNRTSEKFVYRKIKCEGVLDIKRSGEFAPRARVLKRSRGSVGGDVEQLEIFVELQVVIRTILAFGIV